MLLIAHIITVVCGYLLGSIPTGYMAGRIRGIDVRRLGSGNIGATNVFRLLGRKAGIIVLAVDFLKGYLAASAVVAGATSLVGNSVLPGVEERLAIAAGISAVLGHNYTCWLKFKGGKGIATSAGVLVAWVPWALLIVFVIWLVVAALTRYVSAASVASAFCLPPAVWLMGGSLRMIIITSILSVLAIYKHRANIQRLWQGTENRIGGKRPASETPSVT